MTGPVQCRYCGDPAKAKAMRLCGKHHARWLRAGKPDVAAWDGEPALRWKCVICGEEYHPQRGKHTCSEACAAERTRQRDREWKRKKWRQDPEAAKRQQRERRAKRIEHYRQMERRIKARKRQAPVAVCKRCGEEFKAPRKDARYCSERCASPVADLVCQVCGGEYRGRRGSKYCSDPCSHEAALRKQRAARRGEPAGKRAKPRPRNTAAIADGLVMASLALGGAAPQGKYLLACRVCGAEFRSDASHRAFCSEDCKTRDLARRKREAHVPVEIPPRPCIVCGKEFTPDRGNGKTCSQACRDEAKREDARQRARRPEVKERAKLHQRRRVGIQRTECIVCGADLTALPDLRVNRYTCSDECRRQAQRQRNRRSYQNRKNKD